MKNISFKRLISRIETLDDIFLKINLLKKEYYKHM